MPKTVLDQEGKFKRDEILKKLSQDNKIQYVGLNLNDILVEEARKKFLFDIENGYVNVAYVDLGINLRVDVKSLWQSNLKDSLTGDAVKIDDKLVSLQSRFILNGVCVIWKGEICLKNLTGTARIEFDKDMATEEYLTYRSQLEDYSVLFGVDNSPEKSSEFGEQDQVSSASSNGTSNPTSELREAAN